MSGARKRPAPPFLRKRVEKTGRIDRFWRILGIGAVCLALYTLVLGESGWYSLRQQEAEVDDVAEQIEWLQSEQELIAEQLVELEQPASFELERVARDEYGMVREGERVIHVVEGERAP